MQLHRRDAATLRYRIDFVGRVRGPHRNEKDLKYKSNVMSGS